jgi:hypothetical protein
MVRRRPGRGSPRSRSSKRDASASTVERSAADQRLADRKVIFRAALKGALQEREIATQIQREGGITANDLQAQAEQFDDTLWLPAEEVQQEAEALEEELRRLQGRLRIPAVRAVYELIAYPYLQAVVAIAGLLLIVWSFGLKLLRAGGVSGWSRILFFSGVTILMLALVDCIAGYLRTRRGFEAGPPIRPLLSTLTGLAAAALAVVQASRLSQYHTAAQLAFWVLLLTDGAAVAIMTIRTVAARREAEAVLAAQRAAAAAQFAASREARRGT